MRKNNPSIYALLIVLIAILGVFYFIMPQNIDETEAPLSEFSTQRALVTVKSISLAPHYVGSKNHETVAVYLQTALHDLGLETSIQEGFTITEMGTLVKSKNILARIKGSGHGNALLLLSHYDSAPHSFSKGASDDASGVATIIESIRAFLHNKTQHKNDVIILFTDAEEVGLNGAALFVKKHPWAKKVGLVLNFEARGSAGPSYMLMETNQGNAKMVNAFYNAKVTYPVSNSLMYSIYKMLPNDTDLTVFRTEGNIQGFNFAFIDNHYNYHTVKDCYANLNKNTLAHQGTYLFPLLNYFSNADLSQLNTPSDKVYFNVPFCFVSYPFEWILPLLIFAIGLFLLFVFIGLGKRAMRFDEILKGFIPLLGSLLTSGLITYIIWKLLLVFYPQYQDILHGFTYNGHDYIYAFLSLSLCICFTFYSQTNKRHNEMNQMVAPLFIWLIINIGIALKLPGAGFLIIPVVASILMLGLYVLTQKSNWLLNSLLSIPTIIIIVPFLITFPIGLGLKILYGISLMIVLVFTLLLPVLETISNKRIWALILFFISSGYFVKAHLNSEYSTTKSKPNSLVYFLNDNKAYWSTYDLNIDVWTKHYLGEKPISATSLNKNLLYSKYDSKFTYMANAPLIGLSKPTIEFLRDTIKGNQHLYRIKISSNRIVNRYDVFCNNGVRINNLKANGITSINFKKNISSKSNSKIITYYVVDNVPLELQFSINSKEKLDLELLESSFDLLSNRKLNVIKRKSWMVPTPFVLNDAVIVREKIINSPINVVKKLNFSRKWETKDRTKLPIDTIKQ